MRYRVVDRNTGICYDCNKVNRTIRREKLVSYIVLHIGKDGNCYYG